MAIYNKEVERSIFTKIGDDVKDAALKKSLKRRKTLAIAGLVILIIGAIFLMLDFVLNDTTTLLYVIASIITALGFVLLILAPSLHAATKKKYSYDSYNYGQEHYPDVLSQITSGKAGELTPLQRVIIYVDELKQAEIVFTEEKHESHGRTSSSYTSLTYRLTYSDGRTSNATIKSSDTFTMNMLNSYLASKTYAS